MVLSVVILLLTFAWWAPHAKVNQDGWLGGYNFCTLHASLMIAAFAFAFVNAAQSFRFLEGFGVEHNVTKIVHACWHTLAVGLAIAALYFINQFHLSKGWGHLSTLHSWLGVLFLALYSQNWILGGSFFFNAFVPLDWKKDYAPLHRFLGVASLLAATIAMETGIAQKSWLDGDGCLFPLASASELALSPSLFYSSIKPGCRLGFGIGILVAVNSVLAAFALWECFEWTVAGREEQKRGRESEMELPTLLIGGTKGEKALGAEGSELKATEGLEL